MDFHITAEEINTKDFVPAMVGAIDEIMTLIGQVSTSENMILPGGKDLPVNDTKLTTRTGNLARSLLRKTGDFAIHKTYTKDLIGIKGTSIPYAAIHEYGASLTSHPKKPGKISKSFTIKARPFLGKVLSSPNFQRGVDNILAKALNRGVK